MSAPSPLAMVLRQEGDRFCVARYGCVAIVVWGRAARGEDISRLGEVQREAVSEFGHFVTLTIIRAGLSMKVDTEVREGSERNLRESVGYNLGSAVIVEAGGLRATFFRSVISGISLISRSKVPQKVFDTIDVGVPWLIALAGVDEEVRNSADALIAGVLELVDQHGTSDES